MKHQTYVQEGHLPEEQGQHIVEVLQDLAATADGCWKGFHIWKSKQLSSLAIFAGKRVGSTYSTAACICLPEYIEKQAIVIIGNMCRQESQQHLYHCCLHMLTFTDLVLEAPIVDVLHTTHALHKAADCVLV